MRRSPVLAAAVFVLAAVVPGAAVSVSLTPSVNDPQPVGTSITWTANASGASGAVWYRFSVSLNGAPAAIVRDFAPPNAFPWVPYQQEGTYTVIVTARDSAHAEATSSKTYSISSRVVGSTPVVHATSHPLIALYSAPACPSGSQFRVRFRVSNQANYQATPLMPCSNTHSMNMYVAGLYATTTYTMVSDVLSGPRVTSSIPLTFTTGAITASLPAVSILTPPQQAGSLAQGTVFYVTLGASVNGLATDLAGKPIWYFAGTNLSRPVAGGTFMGATPSTILTNNTLSEVDLTGYVVRQTNAARISEQLPALGITDTVNGFHHDARRLPNGNYLVLSAGERILSHGEQGPGDVDVLGDIILVLDPNFQVLWAWDSFDHLDVTRKAVLGETCATGLAAGCPMVFKAAVANDWLHGNSIALTPDGNILYSARHQDFVYKISYQNGTGDGHVIWKLGKGGDFSTTSTDPYPWQSHQHDAEFEDNTLLTLYDNGNTRVTQNGGFSRGQALIMDEVNRRVTYQVNVTLGVYSSALGSAQKLADGNFHYESGNLTPSQAAEVTSSGAVVYKPSSAARIYRSFRMKSLYEF